MNIQKLLQILDTCENPAQRKTFLETVLGVELGYSLSLPSARVESVVAYFEQFHAEVVKRILSEVNEMYPFAVNVTYNLVVDVFKNRYVICHEPRLLSAEDIMGHLQRPAFMTAVDEAHACVLREKHTCVLREEVSNFIRRFIPAQ